MISRYLFEVEDANDANITEYSMSNNMAENGTELIIPVKANNRFNEYDRFE